MTEKLTPTLVANLEPRLQLLIAEFVEGNIDAVHDHQQRERLHYLCRLHQANATSLYKRAAVVHHNEAQCHTYDALKSLQPTAELDAALKGFYQRQLLEMASLHQTLACDYETLLDEQGDYEPLTELTFSTKVAATNADPFVILHPQMILCQLVAPVNCDQRFNFVRLAVNCYKPEFLHTNVVIWQATTKILYDLLHHNLKQQTITSRLQPLTALKLGHLEQLAFFAYTIGTMYRNFQVKLHHQAN